MKKILSLVLFVFILSMTVALVPPVWAQNISIDAATAAEDNFGLDEEIDYAAAELRPDPLERYNRWMFNINDKIYRRLFNPLSRIYGAAVPHRAQKCISNFSEFLKTPVRFANNLLQGKFKNASTEIGRLLINGTVGVAGLFDPAESKFDIKQQSEDFAQTLGSYGVKSGPYIVLPLLGPSDPRDIVGIVVDMAFNPLTWVAADDPDTREVYSIYSIVNNLNNYTYNVRDTYERITDDAIDEYIAIQEVYIQNRDKNIEE